MAYNKITITKFLSVLFASTSIILSSCDNVNDDDRYISSEKPEQPSYNVPKILLIQEFTGDECTNCPQGASAVHTIQTEYPGQVIAVGLHPINNPLTAPIEDQNFRTEEAQSLYEFFNPAGLPCAVFNGESMSTRPSLWYGIASDYVFQEATISIDADVEFNDNDRSIAVNYTILSTDKQSEQLSVMVWLIENDIVGYQRSGNTMLNDYIHNHVLRTSLNGINGQLLPENMISGQEYEDTAKGIIDSDWVPKNCQVVIYVFQSANRTVEQAFIIDVL